MKTSSSILPGLLRELGMCSMWFVAITRKMGSSVTESPSRRLPITSVTRLEWERRASASSTKTRVMSWSLDGLKREARRVLMGLR